MVALKIFCAVLLAGQVGANHFKRHRHFPNYRSQLNRSSAHQPISSVSQPISRVASTTHSTATQPTPVTTTISTSVSRHSSATPSTTQAGTPLTEDSVTADAASPLATTLTPNHIKAGIAGGDAYPYVKAHIGWWYDWSPTPSKPGPPIAVPMLWGNGTADAQDAARLKAFEHLASVPPYVLGFEEPDCATGSGSAGMRVADGVSKWESLIAPLRAKGAKLGSPSMCKQADETWLAEFQGKIKTPWDFTAIHINKNSLDGVKKDIQHYMTYGKPIWVTEFACVNDYQQFTPCTSQDEIDSFIKTVVPYFESNANIYAYAYSNGLGLGDVWPLTKDGSLSKSGQTYLAAISQYH